MATGRMMGSTAVDWHIDSNTVRQMTKIKIPKQKNLGPRTTFIRKIKVHTDMKTIFSSGTGRIRLPPPKEIGVRERNGAAPAAVSCTVWPSGPPKASGVKALSRLPGDPWQCDGIKSETPWSAPPIVGWVREGSSTVGERGALPPAPYQLTSSPLTLPPSPYRPHPPPPPLSL